ncbi:RNA polymerase II-associated protein 1-like [Physella acuta]|uniref:RNA polymerase II-associated protein 1-like n=1 Tax=Physella acuta TaxID=109671 RepID=UPI0027DC4827|nr:RNA polymerase II-associated protein 1-like [Physella acuta]XP_059143142.1 RNA polymerase II-associated protein 1-like [Physella acuta]
MDRRPHSKEDEEDLLKLQKEFLASSQPSSSILIKRPDKRKTEKDEEDKRDVVTMEGVEASGSKADVPLKKLKTKVGFSDQDTSDRKQNEAGDNASSDADIEEMMDRQDRGLAAVLTTIIERDTRNEMCNAPILGKQAFPSVLPMNLSQQNPNSSGSVRKKSLFAQQVEALSASHFGVQPQPQRPVSKFRSRSSQVTTPGISVAGPCVIDGAGLSASQSKLESQNIHEENVQKLSSMSEAEILDEQQKLLKMIDPKLVEFLRAKRKAKEEQGRQAGDVPEQARTFSVQKEKRKQLKKADPELDLPVKPDKNWVHMTTVEKDKLEWMKDLPPPSSLSSETGRAARFDFKGNLLPVDVDLPVNMGLHHHGEEPERAGYTLEELFQLARSSNLQQRSLALHTLARVVSNAKSGVYVGKVETPIIPAILAGGAVILLRWALDDSVSGAITAAIDALHALLFNPLDEEAIDLTWTWYQGNVLPALTPTETLEKESQPEDMDEENKEVETDADVIKRDVVQALVTRMELLTRFRYILVSVRPQASTVVQMLEILRRVAQHSATLAYEIEKCPGLLEKIVQDFLPTAWYIEEAGQPVHNVYGVPLPAALRLMRVLCQSGRNMACILTSKFQLVIKILRYLAVPVSDLQLPSSEATLLHAEAFALWRVCATYGFAVQAYFDLYPNIVHAVGKLESTCSPDQPPSSDVRSDHTRFDVGLISVLEKIVSLAGDSKQVQGLKNHNESSFKEVVQPDINWSHVTALNHPIKRCLVQLLRDIGSSYPIHKQSLHLPTVCINFMATYYEVESKKPSGVAEMTNLEQIEELCETCLAPFWSSFGLTVITENLCSHSNILVPKANEPVEQASSLPSLGVFKFADSEGGDKQQENWKMNLPLLLPHSPFGFISSLLRLALVLCKRHKGLINKLLEPITMNKDILQYMKKTTVTPTTYLSNSHFTQAENLCQYFWLKCCSILPCPDMSTAHKVALNLLSRLHYGDEHLVHDLMSTIIFAPSFISEGEEIQLASQAMSTMSLTETLHLKSATQEQININQCQLLQETYSSLSKIRGHFLMALGGMEKAVQNSRNLLCGNPSAILSQMIKNGNEILMPKDWIYMPLIHVYNNASQGGSISGVSMSPQCIAMVTSVLQWSYAMEIWRSVEIEKISVTVRISRVLCAFIAGADLFLERPVHQYLAGLLRVLSSHKLLDKMDFEEKIPGITSFYDLYQEFLDHYEAVSFGDPVFGMYVLLPLQQKHSPMLRKAVWGERRKMLRTLRVPLEEMLTPLHNYLEPEETDVELLQLYTSSLVTKAVQPVWSPVMYLLAVYHLNRFIYISQQDDKVEVRKHIWSQIVKHKDQMNDVIYFKQANVTCPYGLELYDSLPPTRQAMFNQFLIQSV